MLMLIYLFLLVEYVLYVSVLIVFKLSDDDVSLLVVIGINNLVGHWINPFPALF